MSAYLGSLGQLVPIYSTPSMSVEGVPERTYQTTLEGRVKAQVKPVGRRRWSVDGAFAGPADQGALMGFVDGSWGYGPFVWVPPHAQFTNLLTQGVASCGPAAVFSGSSTVGGPLSFAGGIAGRSLRNSNTAANMPFGKSITPVFPGVAVTGSAYVLGTGSKVGVAFYNAAGAWVSAALSSGTGGTGLAVRLSVTATPPSSAVSCSVYAVSATAGTRPAITWTPRVMEWAPGQGCAKAIVDTVGTEVVLAGVGNNLANLSFTIQEVG